MRFRLRKVVRARLRTRLCRVVRARLRKVVKARLKKVVKAQQRQKKIEKAQLRRVVRIRPRKVQKAQLSELVRISISIRAQEYFKTYLHYPKGAATGYNVRQVSYKANTCKFLDHEPSRPCPCTFAWLCGHCWLLWADN